MRTDGVHFRESTSTRQVVIKAVPVTGAALVLNNNMFSIIWRRVKYTPSISSREVIINVYCNRLCFAFSVS